MPKDLGKLSCIKGRSVNFLSFDFSLPQPGGSRTRLGVKGTALPKSRFWTLPEGTPFLDSSNPKETQKGPELLHWFCRSSNPSNLDQLLDRHGFKPIQLLL